MNEQAPKHRLDRLDLPLGCSEQCGNSAYWAVDSHPYCYTHLLMINTLSDAYQHALHDALISPELVAASTNEVKISIYPTTCLAPVCAILNNFTSILPGVDCEAEVIIEKWEDKLTPLKTFQWVRTGTGYYYIDSTTVRCNAPLIKLARAPQGTMCGFMAELNEHSLKVRRFVGREFQEEQATNG